MSPFIITTLQPSDYDALIALWEEAGLSHRPKGRDARASIVRQMSLPQCRFFAVRGPDGLLLGSALATHEGRKGWVNRVAVRPAARRSGIARALVEACEAWLFAQEVPIVAALVEGPNIDSQALFSACGYERDDSLVYFRKLTAEGL